ncbi:uncharacterized protein [Aquarana catesbeiana]|uniref:uncharacterized protein isoform X2 n=1 Tax=Aquarana catesbeiana TaxID=8400 RepID=UPI003CC9DBC7
MTGECSEVVTGIGEEGDTASEDGGTSSGGGDTALRGSRARMKVKSPPPPGAMMYSLLLLAHMTLAVTASTTFTAGVTPESPQSFTHADRHTDETSAHIPATSKVLGTSAPHTDRHTDATSAHIPATSKVLGTSAPHTDRHTDATSAHIPATSKVLGTSAPHTDRHTDTTSAHIPVIPKVLATSAPHTETITVRQTDRHTKAKIPEIFSTVHHSTFVSEHHSTGIHSTVTKKELQSVTQKTHAPHITKSISVPNVRVEIGNGFQITCFSERGPEVINYELIQGDRIVKNMTVHGRKAATFQFDITPGPSIIYCRARTLSGEEVTSEPLKIEGDNPDSEEKPGDSKKSEKEEWDAAPKFLISLTYILTSVSQPVQDLNAIIISVCGPIILIVLLLIFLTHFCNRRGRKAGSSRLVCCV